MGIRGRTLCTLFSGMVRDFLMRVPDLCSITFSFCIFLLDAQLPLWSVHRVYPLHVRSAKKQMRKLSMPVCTAAVSTRCFLYAALSEWVPKRSYATPIKAIAQSIFMMQNAGCPNPFDKHLQLPHHILFGYTMCVP